MTLGAMPFAAPVSYAPGISPPAALAGREALWFLVRGTQILVSQTATEVPLLPQPPLPLLREHYLGTLGASAVPAVPSVAADRAVFAGEVAAQCDAPTGWRWSDLRPLFSTANESLVALAGRAVQIIDWDRSHQYCGRCGGPTRHSAGDRSRECPACGLSAYPRLAPVMMALVRRPPDRILLARSPRFPAGMYSALAGFVEAGETLEQCVHREIAEEVGITVRNLRYFASQPWPFPHSLMIAFICDYDGGELNPDRVEIEAAEWFRLDALPALPTRISIARRLIDATVADMRARGRESTG